MNIEIMRGIATALAILAVLAQYGLSRIEGRQIRTEAQTREDRQIAQYAIAAMLPDFPVKDSKELDQRVTRYLDALSRARADGRGVPVVRQDGSIGVEWSITITDTIQLSGSLDPQGPKMK